MRKRNWTRTRQALAFTLVELLVVIGIIALLVAMLLPALNRARKQAQLVECMANLRSIGQAIVNYTNNNKGMLPYGYWDGDTGGLFAAVASHASRMQDIPLQSDWTTLLMQNVFSKGDGTWATESLIPMPVFQCPAADISDPNYTVALKLHYGCNPRLMPDIGLSDPANPAVRLRPYRISHIQRSSEVCLIWDAEQVFDLNLFPFSYGNSFPVSDQVDDWGLWQSGPAANLSEVCYYLLMGPGVNGGDAVWTSQQPWLPYYAGVGANGSGNTNRPGSSVYPGPFSAEIQWRHGTNEHVSKANFLFVDGHVETLTLNFGLGSNSNIGINCDLKDRNIYVNPNY